MPKAENRKRPANLLGNVPDRGKHTKSDGVINNPDRDMAQNKKQELLEKMKTLQKNMKTEREKSNDHTSKK